LTQKKIANVFSLVSFPGGVCAWLIWDFGHLVQVDSSWTLCKRCFWNLLSLKEVLWLQRTSLGIFWCVVGQHLWQCRLCVSQRSLGVQKGACEWLTQKGGLWRNCSLLVENCAIRWSVVPGYWSFSRRAGGWQVDCILLFSLTVGW